MNVHGSDYNLNSVLVVLHGVERVVTELSDEIDCPVRLPVSSNDEFSLVVYHSVINILLIFNY